MIKKSGIADVALNASVNKGIATGEFEKIIQKYGPDKK